jgi:trans-aconitate methyltransferase
MKSYLAAMDTKDTAQNYDAIAGWWLQQMKESTYGLAALERTLTFVGEGRHALDVGCGCEGRFFRILLERGFACTGLDISHEMIALARQRYPVVYFVTGDICTWSLPRQYDLITAWDSIFHLPLEAHEPVLEKLCKGLSREWRAAVHLWRWERARKHSRRIWW